MKGIRYWLGDYTTLGITESILSHRAILFISSMLPSSRSISNTTISTLPTTTLYNPLPFCAGPGASGFSNAIEIVGMGIFG